MRKIAAACAISVIAGFAMGAWLMGDAPVSDDKSRVQAAAGQGAAAGRIEARLDSLEKALADERDARSILEEELQALIAEIERIDALSPSAIAVQSSSARESRSGQVADRQPPRDFAKMVRNYQDRRLGALIDSGFPEDEARRVLRQESEAQYQAMQAAHEAQRRGETADPSSVMTGPQALLRAELGDSDYARYLQAQGQPTAIQVTQVLEGSPGSQAGLQSGDQIVSYNGERVFHVNELRTLTLEGNPGEDVVIEIEREGMRMQLSVPRGPVGITGSGANIRNMNWWGGG